MCSIPMVSEILPSYCNGANVFVYMCVHVQNPPRRKGRGPPLFVGELGVQGVIAIYFFFQNWPPLGLLGLFF